MISLYSLKIRILKDYTFTSNSLSFETIRVFGIVIVTKEEGDEGHFGDVGKNMDVGVEMRTKKVEITRT